MKSNKFLAFFVFSGIISNCGTRKYIKTRRTKWKTITGHVKTVLGGKTMKKGYGQEYQTLEVAEAEVK